MQVLDTFYLLFKSDAQEVGKDVEELDKKISKLAAKGKARSQDEEKELQALRKQRRAAIQDIKDQQTAVDASNDSFSTLVESATSAVAAYASFNAIKASVFNNAKFNSDLEVQHQTLGQSVKDIAAYGAAFEQAGGSVEGFQATLRGLTLSAAQQGYQLAPINELFPRLHQIFKDLPIQEALRRGGLQGIPPEFVNFLRSNDFDKFVSTGYSSANRTPEQTGAAREFIQELDKTGQKLNEVSSILGETVLPSLSAFLRKIQDIADAAKGHGDIDRTGSNGGLWDLWGGLFMAIARPDLVAHEDETQKNIESLRNKYATTNARVPSERPIITPYNGDPAKDVLDIFNENGGSTASDLDAAGRAYYAKMAQRTLQQGQNFALSAAGRMVGTPSGGNRSVSISSGDINLQGSSDPAETARLVKDYFNHQLDIAVSNYDDGIAR